MLVIIKYSVTVINIPESELCVRLKDWEANLSENLKLAYLPDGNIVKLRLTGKGLERSSIIKQIDEEIKKLSSIIDF